MSDPFIAEIIMFGGNFAPRGWAFCDGQLLPISQNSALFSLLGTMHRGACILCEEAFEPGKTLLFLERERATIALGWPHFGQALAQRERRQ